MKKLSVVKFSRFNTILRLGHQRYRDVETSSKTQTSKVHGKCNQSLDRDPKFGVAKYTVCSSFGASS